jgi:hypothetical protein
VGVYVGAKAPTPTEVKRQARRGGAGVKKQQVPRCARDDIRGSGRMFPATSHGLRFSHDPSTARPDPSATLRAGVQTTHAENASSRSAQDDRQEEEAAVRD